MQSLIKANCLHVGMCFNLFVHVNVHLNTYYVVKVYMQLPIFTLQISNFYWPYNTEFYDYSAVCIFKFLPHLHQQDLREIQV